MHLQFLSIERASEGPLVVQIPFMEKNEEVERWVHKSGLSQYLEKFYEMGYDDLLTCAHLQESDLDSLGITLPGKRRAAILHSQLLKSELRQEETGTQSLEKTSSQINPLGKDFYSRALPTRLVYLNLLQNSIIPKNRQTR